MPQVPTSPSKKERFAKFVRRLQAAAAARTFDEARLQLADILNAVEDELTDIPPHPEAWQSDGRMYPPHDDFEKLSPHPAWRRFRSLAHTTLIGANGSIRILEVPRPPKDWTTGPVVLDKPGADGRWLHDL